MKSRRRINKLLTALLAAALAAAVAVCSIAVFSNVANAADTSYCSHASHDEWTELSSGDVSDGYIEISKGGKYYLGENLNANILVTYKGDVALCLNGFTLTGTGVQTGKSSAAGENSYYCNDSTINVQEGACFYICDCSSDESGVITGGSCNYGLVCVNRAEVYLCSGAITENIETPDLQDADDDFELEDVVGGNSNVAGGVSVADGTFYMEGGKISGNRGSVGGIYLLSDGTSSHAYFEMNGGEISGNTGYYGGGLLLHNSGTSVALNGGKIYGNVAEWGGGIYVSSGGEDAVQIVGGEISGNVADCGGGIYATSGTIKLEKGEISGNKAYKDGGGAYVASKAEFDIYSPSNVRSNYTGSISNNEAENGGGVYVGGGATLCLSLDAYGRNYEGAISYNKAINGGGVYVDDDGAFTTSMEGTNNSSSSGYTRGELRIEYNEAEECGGGIYGGIEYDAPNSGQLYSVSISYNKAACGGGMYVGAGTSSEPNARYEISENAAEYGGGVYAEGYCKLHCDVLSNEATLDGGGMYVKDATFEIDGSSSRAVDSNKAGRNGGGIYLAGDSYFETVSGTSYEITNNEAACGGGIYLQSGSISFSHPILIEGNSAGAGGGLYMEDGYISSEKSSSVYSDRAAMEIFENFANLGGGVYMAGGEMDLSSADISGNSAKGEGAEEGLGGGIYMAGGTLIMYDGFISENNAASGGGIYASDGSLTILGGTISGNSATNGGGAYISEGTVTMNGGEISGNEAVEKGGGVYMGVGTFNVQGSPVIAENSTDSQIDENLYLTGEDFITVTGVLSEDALLYVAVDYVPSDINVPMMAVWSDNAYSEGILEHFVSENGYILHRNETEMCIELVLIHTVGAEMEYGGTNLEITLKDTHDNEMHIKSGYTTVFYDENYAVIDESDILTMTPDGTYYISVHVEASEDYTAFDSELHSLTVTKKDISNAEIVLGEALVYNFEEQTQTIVSVTIDGIELVYEVGYVIVDDSNIGTDAVGTDEYGNYITDADGNYITKVYTLEIEGTGYFTGTASTTFTIARLEISDKGLWSLQREWSFVYDGEEHSLIVTSFTYDGRELEEGVDFEVVYTPQVDVCKNQFGDINGLGNLGGSLHNYYFQITARDISDAEVSIEYDSEDESYLTSFVYNGEEQGPAIIGITIHASDLKEEGLYLTESTDFTVSGYMADAGTYDLTITGKGNYTGSITVSFTINPLDISEATVVLGSDLVYSGEEQEQTVAAVYVDDLLLDPSDYEVLNNSATEVGEYTLYVVGTGANTTGYISVQYKVYAQNIDDYEIVLVGKKVEFVYNGTAQGPTIESITVGGTPISDYELSNATAVDVGGYTLTINLGGEYSGNVLHVSYSIVALDISSVAESDIEIDWGEQLTYNGEAQIQKINGITVNNLELTYELSENVQTDAGTYTLTITGTGNFEGTIEREFTISQKSIEGADVSLDSSHFTYNGEKQTPTISSVSVDGLTVAFDIAEGECEGNFGVDADMYTLVITPTGNNFTGQIEVTFTIDPLDIGSADVRLEGTLTYDRTEQTQNIGSVTIEVDTTEGILNLTDGVDYTVSGNNQTDAGSYTMTLTGQGNYTGTLKVDFTIEALSIEGAEIDLSQNDFSYNGSYQRPEVTNVVANGIELEASEYSVTIGSNKSAGEYAVTVTAKGGNFTGTAETTYTIFPLSLSEAVVNVQDLTFNGSERDISISSVKIGDIQVSRYDYEVTIGGDGVVMDAGTYTFTITSTSGNFTDSYEGTFEVIPREISSSNVDIVLGDTLTYNGREQTKQILSVTWNGIEVGYKVLDDSDKGTSSGTYTLYIEADDSNFTGTAHTSFTIEKLDISEEGVRVEVILESYELTYTGELQHPAISSAYVYITVDGTEDEGHKLSYIGNYDSNAIDAGTYKITVSADGVVGHTDFTGSVEVEYTIVPRVIEEIEYELEYDEYVYNGAVQSPVVVAVNGIWRDTDNVKHRFELDSTTYEVFMPTEMVNAGTYTFTITISEGGNYSAEEPFTFEFVIEKYDISSATVKMAEHEAFTYNGEVQTQEIESVTVTLNGEEKEIEFNVSGNSTRYAGTHIITITPVDDENFTGHITRSFTIGRLDISGVTVVDYEAEKLTYNGQEQDVPAVSYITITWTENKEGVETEYSLELKPSNYTVSGDRQSEAGTYMLTVTGADNCTGELQLSFEILPLDISEAEIVFGDSLTYNGQEQTITIASITVDGVKVDEYTISGDIVGTDAGDYPLVIEGKGNFTGTFETTFTINPKSIEGADVTIESDHFTYDGAEHTLIVTVVIDGLEATYELICYDGDGNEVQAVKAGTYTIIVSGTGNFTGSIEEILTIDKAIPEYTEPTGLTAERGDTLGDVELPEGWTWDSYLDYQFDVSGASYYFWATYTPDDTEDYETVTVRLKVVVASESQNDYGASLSIVEYPTQMEYTAFDTFDPDGIVLSIELEDGSSITVEDASIFDHEITNGDSLTRDVNGQCEIIITYYIPIEYLDSISGGSGISLLADYEDHPEKYIALSVVFHVTVNKLTPSIDIETSDLAEGSSGDGSYSFADILTMSDGEVTYKFYTRDENGEYVEYTGDIYEAPTGTYYIKVFISETNNCEAAESDYYEFNIVEAAEGNTDDTPDAGPDDTDSDESDSVRTASIIATVVAGAVIVISLIVLIFYLTRKRKY